jgi:hypothetical protein
MGAEQPRVGQHCEFELVCRRDGRYIRVSDMLCFFAMDIDPVDPNFGWFDALLNRVLPAS